MDMDCMQAEEINGPPRIVNWLDLDITDSMDCIV